MKNIIISAEPQSAVKIMKMPNKGQSVLQTSRHRIHLILAWLWLFTVYVVVFLCERSLRNIALVFFIEIENLNFPAGIWERIQIWIQIFFVTSGLKN